MRFAVIPIDKPNAQQFCQTRHDDHLAYVAKTGGVELAGPFQSVTLREWKKGMS